MADPTPNPQGQPGVNVTPPANPNANQITPDVGDPGAQPPVQPPSPEEEVAFNQLSGKAQDRFSEMFNRARTAEEELEKLKTRSTTQAQDDLNRIQPTYTPPVNNNNYAPTQPSEQEIRDAINKLTERGIATRDDIKSEVQQAITDIRVQQEHDHLTQKYGASGSKYPEYKPQEVEDYGRRHRIFNLEAAYRDMYFDEIADIERGQGPKPQPPITQTPNAAITQHEQPLTMETLREKLQSPSGREWYEKQMAENPAEFNALIAKLSAGNQ